MNTRCAFLPSRPRAVAGLLLLSALAFWPSTAQATDAPSAIPAMSQAPGDRGWDSPSPSSTWTPAVLAESWWERMLHPIETGLTTRTRMIQFGALMMLLALWVIWWRK